MAASDLSSPHETPATAYAAAGARLSCFVAACRARSRSVAPRRDRSGLSRIAAIHWQGSLGLVLRRVNGSPVTRRRLAVRKSGGENEDRSAKRAKIRALNDAFRTSFWGGRVMMTAGVAALENPVRNAVVEKIKAFDAFDDDNDPWGEHDFVSVEHDGQTFFAKIDLYERAAVKHYSIAKPLLVFRPPAAGRRFRIVRFVAMRFSASTCIR